MKQKTIYVCSECGARSPNWQGRCHSCGAWSSFVEQKTAKGSLQLKKAGTVSQSIKTLREVDSDGEFRLKTGIGELDRVLGGGAIPGSIVLVGGDPGIGKSTLMLQMCAGLAERNPLYVTGEESLRQIKFRASRLKGIPEDMAVLAETNVEEIVAAIKDERFGAAIVDSIQSVFSEKIDSAPGGYGQVRECASILMQAAKQSGKPVFIVGHVTKEGVIAGPKLLEHLVDAVLQFEGEKTYAYRILRSLKNRYGSTNEMGIFKMTETGMVEVTNPSELFLAERNSNESGVAIVAAYEGARPILLEIQALAAASGFSVPQRTCTGFDSRRLNMILAVLEKRLGEPLSKNDVFVNVAGGVYLSDPSVDLGVAAAVVSSLRDVPIDISAPIVGEIGLTGETRPVSFIEQRIREAEKLGFESFILPAAKELNPKKFKIKLKQVERISLALNQILK